MLKRKPSKCATPSIKELLDALDLEERNESRASDRAHQSAQPAYLQYPPTAPAGAPSARVAPEGFAFEPPGVTAHDQFAQHDAIAEVHSPYQAPYQVWPAPLVAQPQAEPTPLKNLWPEPLRSVATASPAHTSQNDDARVRLAALSRSRGWVTHAVAVAGTLVVMVPSALYLVAPLLWPSATPATVFRSASTVQSDDTKTDKRPLAVASVAVVPVAPPRAAALAALGAAPLAASDADRDRFSALSNAATSMQLPSAVSPPVAAAQPPTPAAAPQPAPSQKPAAAAMVPRAQPAEPQAAPRTAAPLAIATTTGTQAPTTATGTVAPLAFAPEPLRARVPLTALSADPPAFVATTNPAAAASIGIPASPHRIPGVGTATTPATKATAQPAPKDSVTAARATILVERGRQLAAAGDIVGARLLYDMAAKSGNAEGKRLLEETLATATTVKSAANAGAIASAGARSRPEGASGLGAPGAGEALRQQQAAPGQ